MEKEKNALEEKPLEKEKAEEEKLLNAALEKQRLEYEGKIKALKRDFAVETALVRAGARNLRAAKALIDLDSLDLDEKGEVTGLKEQLEGLARGEDTSFLFEREKSFAPEEESGAQDTESMSYKQLCSYFENK